MKTVLRNFLYRVFRAVIIRRAAPGAIYLTFDDGPHPEYTAGILRALERHRARATFFMLGKHMEAYPEIVEHAIRAGHTIGYHSYKHKSLKKRNLRQLREDFANVDQLSARFAYPIRLYRPPFGDLTPLALLWMAVRGWKIVMWSVDCRDSFDSLEQVKANIAPDKLSDGDIILLHDDYPHVEEIVDTALARYRDFGLVCKPL